MFTEPEGFISHGESLFGQKPVYIEVFTDFGSVNNSGVNEVARKGLGIVRRVGK